MRRRGGQWACRNRLHKELNRHRWAPPPPPSSFPRLLLLVAHDDGAEVEEREARDRVVQVGGGRGQVLEVRRVRLFFLFIYVGKGKGGKGC